MGPGRKKPAVNTAGRSQKPTSAEQPSAATPSLPLELQQIILNVFHHAFPLADQGHVRNVIQTVKGHLYNRDFASAFSKPEYLEAYALRWSAGRALCYAEIFCQVAVPLRQGWDGGEHTFDANADADADADADAGSLHTGASKVVCIGGGAGAEVVALAATVQALPTNTRMEVFAIDIADWTSALTKLKSSLTTPPQLSAYASEAAKAANKPLIEPERLQVEFVQQDILAYEGGELDKTMVGVRLCTIMFTLNELFTSSLARTTAFLLALTDAIECGSSLLVVDSPGSYSEIHLGSDQKSKRYPMKWLLDHTLLEVVGTGRWQKTLSDDSRWYRVPPALKYPLELENMRCQIHVYEKQDK